MHRAASVFEAGGLYALFGGGGPKQAPDQLPGAGRAPRRTVLLRPKFGKLHGLSETEIDRILVDIARHAIVLSPARTTAIPLAPDSGDQFLWNLLASRADLVLVTKDKLLLQDEVMQQH